MENPQSIRPEVELEVLRSELRQSEKRNDQTKWVHSVVVKAVTTTVALCAVVVTVINYFIIPAKRTTLSSS